MKKFTNFNFGDSRMDREWTEVEPRMDRSTLATMCRYIAVIFAVLVMSIANVGTAWGEDIVMTTHSAPSTKGKPIAGTNGIYYTRGGGGGKSVTVSDKTGVSPSQEGFVFTLPSECEIILNTIRSSSTSTWNTFSLYAVGDTLQELYKCALRNDKTLSAELITWNDSTGKKKAFYTRLGITKAEDNSNKTLTGEISGKFKVATQVGGGTYSKPESLGTASTSIGTYAAGTYLLYMAFGDNNLGLTDITLVPAA